VKAAIAASLLAKNFKYAAEPRIVCNLDASTTAKGYINIWDSQAGTRARGIIDKPLLFGTHSCYRCTASTFGTLQSPCISLCFLHATKMWSRVWRGTPHSHRCDSLILNHWKYDPIGACPSIDRHMRVKTDKRPLTSPSQAPPLAKFRPPLAGRPIGDFGGFQLGVQPCLLISCLTMSLGGFLQPPYLVLQLPDLLSAFTPPK